MNFTGFLAQEVAAVAEKMNYDFSSADKKGKIWGLRYSEFVVPIIKAIQEQQAIIEDQNKKIALQQEQINTLLIEMNMVKEKTNSPK